MHPAFVTGGSGFVGKQLIKDLRARGVVVRALVRSQASSEVVSAIGAEPVIGGLHDVLALENGMKGCEIVFHCASSLGVNIGDDDVLHRDNVVGTHNVINAAIKVDVKRLVYVSSLTVQFDGSALVSADESLPIPSQHPSYYATSKAEAERAVLSAARIETIVVRLPAVWGGGDSILPGLVRMARRGLWVWPDAGRHLISSLHVINASAGLILLAERGHSGQIYNICDDDTPSFRELFNSRLKNAGCKPWQIGDAVFSRNFPPWILWILVVVCEILWRYLPLPGTPLIPREGIAIASTEMTANDSKARKLGYKAVVNRELGLIHEGQWIRSVMNG
jgi:nucleoside-diphosphate-sugar epimerase